MYRGYYITVERDSNGRSEWVAYDRGSLIASGSKSYVFAVIDGLMG